MTTGSLAGVQPLGAASMDSATRVTDLVRVHHASVWRLVRRFGVREADADDAAQQVFMLLAAHIDRVEEGRERSFLVGVAVRVAAAMRRKAHHQREVYDERIVIDTPDTAPHPEEHLDQRRARELLDHLLDEMPDDLRVVFVLYEIERFTSQQIATLLELPAGTVASRLRRAREDFAARVDRVKARFAFRGGA